MKGLEEKSRPHTLRLPEVTKGLCRFVALFLEFLLLTSPMSAHASPACVVPIAAVPETQVGSVSQFYPAPGGQILLGGYGYLYQYNGREISEVEGDWPGLINEVYVEGNRLLVVADNGLFHYNGSVRRVPGDTIEDVIRAYKIGDELLILAENGLFIYDGSKVEVAPGSFSRGIYEAYESSNGLLMSVDGTILYYDNGRVVRVPGELPGNISDVHSEPGGSLIAAANGLFRFDGVSLHRISDAKLGSFQKIFDTSKGVVVASENSLFRYSESRILPVAGPPTGFVYGFAETTAAPVLFANNGLFSYGGASLAEIPGGKVLGRVDQQYSTQTDLLLATERGVFRYDGAHVNAIDVGISKAGDLQSFYFEKLHKFQEGFLLSNADGETLYYFDGTKFVHLKEGGQIGKINAFYDMPDGVLIAGMRGLFQFDGVRVAPILGASTGPAYAFQATSRELLLGAENGMFRLAMEPLTAAETTLDNISQLKGAVPSSLGIPTRWSLTHPCAQFSADFDLHVVASNARGEDVFAVPALGFRSDGNKVSFEATVPVPTAEEWTFRVVSRPSLSSGVSNIGKPSPAIEFVLPVPPGLIGWITTRWPQIAGSSVALLAICNLIVFGASRYWAAAWRLATDESWGSSILLPQRLLLRHFRLAQLWLLDLYVRDRRRTLKRKEIPFLTLPVRGPNAVRTASDAMLERLLPIRHLWVQGGAGMGKTALFLHLRQTHFCRAEASSFSIFRRAGYVLLPIEARRFPQVAFGEQGPSAWVIGCALSVLSEGGLSFEDRDLFRAMLRKGTLAIAIDGLNEVGHTQAVISFAAEYPTTPLFVTSQDAGEAPFEVWHLPGTISTHTEELLALYLGEERARLLGAQLRKNGLMQHLRSGYDVRLVIDLFEADNEGRKLPSDRIDLYRAAVSAAWPEGDNRVELLQAGAWKLLSERGPNEDKRRLAPDVDAPRDLLEQLEAVRERSGRNIRLIRSAPPFFEFVHDQMNAYLAAAWFADRPTITTMTDLLTETKAWQDGLEAQRTLWGFVASLLDRKVLETLWIFAGDDDRRAVLARALAERAEREFWTLTRPALTPTTEAVLA